MVQSTTKHTNKVQFRSSTVREVLYEVMQFPDGVPLWGSNVTLLSDHPSYLHHHNALEIGYCCEGYGVLMAGPGVYNFSPGDISIIKPGIPHMHMSSNNSATECRWLFLFIDAYRFPASFAADIGIDRAEICNPDCSILLRKNKNRSISTIFKEIFSEIQSGEEHSNASALGLTLSLLCKLKKIPKADESQHAAAATCSPFSRITPALHFIAQHYMEEITVSDMANECYTSEPQLRRLFIKSIGQSPLAHLTKFRLWMASSLLENSELSILEIAGRVGYASSSSFYRHFLAEFGKSPRLWRKENC